MRSWPRPGEREVTFYIPKPNVDLCAWLCNVKDLLCIPKKKDNISRFSKCPKTIAAPLVAIRITTGAREAAEWRCYRVSKFLVGTWSRCMDGLWSSHNHVYYCTLCLLCLSTWHGQTHVGFNLEDLLAFWEWHIVIMGFGRDVLQE